MAQSAEFSEYLWVPPKSWTNASRRWMDPTHLIVIHTTEGSEGPSSAEDGAAYDQRRTDGTSAHFYVDSDSIVQCVKTEDKAHTAKGEGNTRGIHIEVCGRAGQSAAQWDDPVSRATVEKTAELCVRLLGKYPCPVVKLTGSQVRNGVAGFCGHKDISDAFGQSTHTDPGPNFPWGRLFSLINAEVGMSATEYANEVWGQEAKEYYDDDGNTIRDLSTRADALYKAAGRSAEARDVVKTVDGKVDELDEKLDALGDALARLTEKVDLLVSGQ